MQAAGLHFLHCSIDSPVSMTRPLFAACLCTESFPIREIPFWYRSEQKKTIKRWRKKKTASMGTDITQLFMLSKFLLQEEKQLEKKASSRRSEGKWFLFNQEHWNAPTRSRRSQTRIQSCITLTIHPWAIITMLKLFARFRNCSLMFNERT